MKNDRRAYVGAMAVLIALTFPMQVAAQQYTIKDLGPADEWTGGVNNKTLVDGTGLLLDGTDRAFVWRNGKAVDLGTFGGPNSVAFKKPSESGLVVGKAETSRTDSTRDPSAGDFCMFGTQPPLICLPFVWQNGIKTPLPTLGGRNGIAFAVNNRSQLAGMAENTTTNPSCSGTIREVKAVIWEKGEIEELPTYSGDNDSAVISINDYGQAVGVSSDCISSPRFLRNVLWKDGTVIDLGNLGGTYNEANNINNLGQVVGLSGASGTSFHAFLWTEDRGMLDLGVLPGDSISFAHANNDKGWIVGASCTADFDCRAVLWRDGHLIDLNSLIPSDSPFTLVEAFDINSRGEILSWGAVGEQTHDYLLTPGSSAPIRAAAQAGKETRRPPLPEKIRQLLRRNVTSLHITPGSTEGKTPISSSGNTDFLQEVSTYYAHGECVVGSNGDLSGYCFASIPFAHLCTSRSDTAQCPPGLKAITPTFASCGLSFAKVDTSRACTVSLQ